MIIAAYVVGHIVVRPRALLCLSNINTQCTQLVVCAIVCIMSEYVDGTCVKNRILSKSATTWEAEGPFRNHGIVMTSARVACMLSACENEAEA